MRGQFTHHRNNYLSDCIKVPICARHTVHAYATMYKRQNKPPPPKRPVVPIACTGVPDLNSDDC